MVQINLVQHHYIQFESLFRGKKLRRVRLLVWHATCWCLWLYRNSVIFKDNFFPDVQNVVYHIQRISWTWMKYKGHGSSSLSFANWCTSPLLCF
ncbi:hypothetical protein JHK82_017095 [Glycine max]|uniref:Uncharacterized protein n=2 Tax=Glycine subgen. Soja TaxID=1462606 RepID=K7KYP3_SOYBN|nr:hypothetical protein JHK85_017519 [Glycine max]KAG5150214.1 hypothetical protein JHK82_017095 [Glycine max]KAH1128583.1 hypothetical protein GYH30_016904 [Glycine max]KRH56422.1 hypothetical protein GLYMA_06G322900v4 [Glycine max]